MPIISITAENYEKEVLKADVPVLLDFWAAWCGPCKKMSPVLDSLALEVEGKVKVCKINVDEVPTLARDYGITGIPTMVVVRGGETVATHVGGLSKEEIIKLLNT